jgi:hypothetical protein
VTDKPIGAYPNKLHIPTGWTLDNDLPTGYRTNFGIDAFVGDARRWVELGATMVGGCCVVESMEYLYAFSDALQQSWNWTERYASQGEILAYASDVADRFALRDAIRFNTSVNAATCPDTDVAWQIETDIGARVTSRFLINRCVIADNCDHGEWAFRNGTPMPLGEPALVHYEELHTRPGPYYVR